MTEETLSVEEVLTRVQRAVVAEFPSPVWVRGEVTGLRRTSRGAVFFRLADSESAGKALEVAARGRVMLEVDRVLSGAGLGRLADGVQTRIKGTLDIEAQGSRVRLSLHQVDPAFTAGRMALDRAEVIRRMIADGSMAANGSLSLPVVPLRVGLVTSRGSAAHADFTDQLRSSGYRFHVKTAHTSVQGAQAAESIAAALQRVSREQVDVIALLRGGGSKLDLSVFDTEVVARAIAEAPVAVITGVGHEIDRSVADEAAAVSTKTPSAAGEWIVARVRDFADRIAIARYSIHAEAISTLRRHHQMLRAAAGDIEGSSSALHRQRDALDRLRGEIVHGSRSFLERRQSEIAALADWFRAVDLEPTLKRGFAIVTGADDRDVIRSVGQVSPGDRLAVRLADGTVHVVVEET